MKKEEENELTERLVDFTTDDFDEIIKRHYATNVKVDVDAYFQKMGMLVDNVEIGHQYTTGTDTLYIAYTGEMLSVVMNNLKLTELFGMLKRADLEALNELAVGSWERGCKTFTPHPTERQISIGVNVKTPLLTGENHWRYDSFHVGYEVSSLTPQEELVQLLDNLSMAAAYFEYVFLYYSYGLRKKLGLMEEETQPPFS